MPLRDIRLQNMFLSLFHHCGDFAHMCNKSISICSDDDFDETDAKDSYNYDDAINSHLLDRVGQIGSESENSDSLSLPDETDDYDFDELISRESTDNTIMACDYGASHLAQPSLVVAAALVLLVIEKNMSVTALDSIMSVLIVSFHLSMFVFHDLRSKKIGIHIFS